jgi:hypothetical protein
MKSSKSVSNAPEYAQLLGEFDKAESAYKQAKAAEKAAKYTLKRDSKSMSNVEKKVLKLTLDNTKHQRKAAKITVRIAQLRINQWLKDSQTAANTEGVAEEPKRHGAKPKGQKEATEKKTGKPGRPSNKKAAMEESIVAAAVAVLEAPAPKKRGRQPKVSAPEVEVEEGVSGMSARAMEVPAPKKRGKQAKVAEPEVEVEEGVSGMSARAMEAPEPPKRGKQPKAAVIAVSEEEVLAPKKRGRQTKVEETEATTVAEEVHAAEPTAPKEKRPRRSHENIAAEKAAAEAAAKAALKGDDFRILEGIGPKFCMIMAIWRSKIWRTPLTRH